MVGILTTLLVSVSPTANSSAQLPKHTAWGAQPTLVKTVEKPNWESEVLTPLKKDQAAKAEAERKAAEEAAKLAAQAAVAAPAVVAAAPVADANVNYQKSYVRVYVNTAGGNGYTYGNCTWYVKNRRPDIPNNWGNASSWLWSASAAGWSTGKNPAVGAIAVSGGHVAYVEKVNGDGTVTISEMNFWGYGGGFGRVSYRTTSASAFSYIY